MGLELETNKRAFIYASIVSVVRVLCYEGTGRDRVKACYLIQQDGKELSRTETPDPEGVAD